MERAHRINNRMKYFPELNRFITPTVKIARYKWS